MTLGVLVPQGDLTAVRRTAQFFLNSFDERLNDALRIAVTDPKNNQAMIDSGAQPVGNSPAEHAAMIRSEIAKWKKVAAAAGLKPM